MAEEQRQSLGADEQPIDNTLNEPSIGMLYDKEKDQTKVFSQNPDGSIGTVDPTPENESLFFVMDKNIPLNFYKNLQKYHNNPAHYAQAQEIIERCLPHAGKSVRIEIGRASCRERV